MREERGEDFFFLQANGGQGVYGVYRDLVRGLAFMVIASQHPFIRWLSGGSDFVVEVFVCCNLAGQTFVKSSGGTGALQ